MTFEKVDFHKETLIEMLKREKVGAINSLLELFRQSRLEVVEVKDFKHKDAGSCVSSIQANIKRNNIKDITARTIKGKVYLFNLEIIGGKE